LGDLMDKPRVTVTSGTATCPPAPVVSAGLGKLVTPKEAPAADLEATVELPTKVRVALLAADVLISVAAVAVATHDALRGGWVTVLAVGAVGFGAWLGWLGLVPQRTAR
jgi:chorismate-pyruvate lyase